MDNPDKLVIGDKIYNKRSKTSYIVTGTDTERIYVRKIIDGKFAPYQEVYSTNLKGNIIWEDYKKIFEWGDWQLYNCPNGESALYKTNRKKIIFKCGGYTVHSTCHKDDKFDLKVGLLLCYKRYTEKKAKKEEEDFYKYSKDYISKFNHGIDTIKATIIKDTTEYQKALEEVKKNGVDKKDCIIFDSIPNSDLTIKHETKSIKNSDKKNIVPIKRVDVSDLTGKTFGDFVATEIIGHDSSRHYIWECVCPTCGSKIHGRSYELKKSPNLTCETCEKIKEEAKKKKDDYLNSNLHKAVNEAVKEYSGCWLYDPKKLNNIFVQTEPCTCVTQEVTYSDSKRDLLTYPTFYYIAQCIGDSLMPHGETAHMIDDLYYLEYVYSSGDISEDWYGRNELGDCLLIKNVFNLITTTRNNRQLTMKTLEKCVQSLAEQCLENDVTYLAMPRIGCGKNKLNWEEVKEMILKKFEMVYADTWPGNKIPVPIHIEFCSKD